MDNYSVFARNEYYNTTYRDKFDILLATINNPNSGVKDIPWTYKHNGVGSMKLLTEDSMSPVIPYFKRFRSSICVYGFLCGVVYVLKHWKYIRPERFFGEKRKEIGRHSDNDYESWASIADCVIPSVLIECINFYSPPNGSWFMLEDGSYRISVRGGNELDYYPVIEEYKNRFFGRTEMYWLLTGICYTLCPEW